MRPAFYVLLGVLLVPTVGLVGDIVTDGKFKSTKLTGAPLQVASDDVVLNLNADMVDGIEGTNLYTRAEVDALVAAAAAADSRPRFYLTEEGRSGADADTACDPGFHMASIWEIHDSSNLIYDTSRGFTTSDSGGGLPAGYRGWARTGHFATTDNVVGQANCAAWSSSSSDDYGTLVWLDNAEGAWVAPATNISPWSAQTTLCMFDYRLWCIENLSK